MDFDTLKTFVTLANIGNFTQTAQQQLIVQSTVSTRIKELEQEVGHQLLIRERKRLILTPAGEHFLSYANQLLSIKNQAITELYTLGTYTNHLRIGSVYTLYDCHIPYYLSLFMKTHPETAVNMILDHSRNLLNMLYDDMIDICFTYRKFDQVNFRSDPFYSDPIILVTSCNNREYENGITQDALRSIPLFYSDFIEIRDSSWFYSIFPKYYTFPLKMNIGNKLVHFLKQGYGYSFLPKSSISTELRTGELIEIPLINLLVPDLQSYIVVKNSLKNPALQQWLDILEREPRNCNSDF